MNKKLIFLILTTVMCAFIFCAAYVSNLQRGIAEKVVRLHIVAADDEICDQLAKLCVRDKILESFAPVLYDCQSPEVSITRINSLIPEIEACANAELLRLGKSDKVSAKTEICRFPTKVYGNITLPAGSYTALNIKIGAAEGRNWWCVMYPPLCITDSVVSVPDTTADYLKERLTDEEYRFITDDAVDIKIKLRLAEILFRK